MSTPSTVARSKLPRYWFVTPDVNDMVACGIQSIIKYNGLVLNDRLRPDRYYITEIDGLGSPDIRDNREELPGDHGEVAYQAFWGGDTITIEGTMHAGNVFELGRMERDLRAAFGTLVETPMKFCWWDVHDEFSDGKTSAAMWAAIAQRAVFPGDGTMQFVYATSDLSNPAMLYYALRQYIDHSVTEKFTMAPTTNDAQTLPYGGILAKCSAATSYLYGTASPTTLTLGACIAGTPTTLVSTAASLFAGQQYWLRLQTVGDTVTLAVYQVDPALDPSATPLATITEQLAGSYADQFGFKQPGFAGVYVGGQNATQIVVEDFRVDAIWPCDMVTKVRPIASPAIKNIVVQSDGVSGFTRYKRDFQLMVRASNPRLTQPTQNVASTPPLTTVTSQVSLARPYPHTFKQIYSIPANPSGEPASLAASTAPIALCVNRGSWLAQPVITIYGGVSFPVLLDLDTDNFILLDGEIALGDFVVVDVAARTVTNASGQSVFGLWDPASTWLQLAPRLNRYLFSGQSIQGSPYASIAWANTWK